MDTLADRIIRYSYDKRNAMERISGRSGADFRVAMLRAHRFVLDKPMAAFMADLSTVVYRSDNKEEVLESTRRSALLPHDVTWVEFDGPSFRRRLIELGVNEALTGEQLAGPGDVAKTWGLLMERHPRIPTAVKLTEFLTDDYEPLPMPISHVWNVADEPLPWKNVCHKSGMLAGGVLGYVSPYVGTLLPTHPTPDKHWRMVKFDKGEPFKTHMMVIETAGVVRYALAFLAALSDMPTIQTKVEGGGRYYVRGKYQKFLDHTVVRLNIPAKRDTMRLALKLISNIHRRAHKVREHWRLHERNAKPDCRHQWGAVGEDNRAYCQLCPAWRTRIVEHVRGDASLGFVQHSYSVHHAQQ